MKLFSNRKRPVHLGPFPLERLRRQPQATPVRLNPASPANPRATSGFGRVVEEYLDAYLSSDSIPVATGQVELPDPQTLTRELKATSYFLDASQVGVCEIISSEHESNGFAVVLVVEYGRQPEDDNAASGWIAGTVNECAALRAAEIAVVLAGYIRQLGHEALVHVEGRGRVDLGGLALAAGLLVSKDPEPTAPFIGPGFALAAVVTSLPLAVDRPLQPGSSIMTRALHTIRRRLGIGGIRSGFESRGRSRRPSHMGPYPMETIRRQDQPTTLIMEDEVPRVPGRAGFFNRARHGDLGDKARREVNRFATKHPLAFAMKPLMEHLASCQDGPVGDRDPLTNPDPAANARAVKSLSYFLGTDMVGICDVPRYAWYTHDANGRPLEARHPRAIVMLIDQGQETTEGASGDDWISGTQSMRAYLRGAEIAGLVAAHLRSLGYSARAQTNKDSEVLQLPLVLHAGLGELSRIGELVLNPFLGPRVKSVVVTTDMPLELDRPIDFGLQDICNQCRKCARECPCNAISHKDKVIFNGYEMWKPDVERCTRYRVTNPRGSSCGRCMKVCPFANEGLITHRLFLWLAVHVPVTRRWIIRLDDLVGNGSRNPVKQWWRDLVRDADGTVSPASSAHIRDLRVLDRSKASTQTIAYYPASVMPPATEEGHWPLDRKQALAAELKMETPDAARERHRAGRQ